MKIIKKPHEHIYIFTCTSCGTCYSENEAKCEEREIKNYLPWQGEWLEYKISTNCPVCKNKNEIDKIYNW